MTEYFVIRLLGPTVNLKLKWRDREPLISMKTCSRISFGDWMQWLWEPHLMFLFTRSILIPCIMTRKTRGAAQSLS